MLGTLLVACGKKLDGKYTLSVAGTGADYDFDGSKVTITVKVLGQNVASAEGTYSIEDDKITFEFESEDEEVEKYSGTFDFEEGEDYIKIGVLQYTKAD